MWLHAWLLIGSTAAAAPHRAPVVSQVHAEHQDQFGDRAPAARKFLREPSAPPPSPDVTVYGYHPYWGPDPTTLDFSRLTHLAIFNVDLQSDGTLTDTDRVTKDFAQLADLRDEAAEVDLLDVAAEGLDLVLEDLVLLLEGVEALLQRLRRCEGGERCGGNRAEARLTCEGHDQWGSSSDEMSRTRPLRPLETAKVSALELEEQRMSTISTPSRRSTNSSVSSGPRTKHAVDKQSANARGLVSAARYVTIISWTTYPIVYILPMLGLDSAKSALVGIQIGYSISDFIAKCVVGYMVTRIAIAKSKGSMESVNEGLLGTN